MSFAFLCRCTTPADHAPAQPATSNLRIALQDFRLNPCTSRDGPPGSADVATSAPLDADARPPAKLRGQKAIADFFKRSDSAGHAAELPGARAPDDACAGTPAVMRASCAAALANAAGLTGLCAAAGGAAAQRTSDDAGRTGSAPHSPPTLAAGGPATPASAPATRPQPGSAPRHSGPSADAQIAALSRHVDVLKAEKATLLGELQRQKELQSQQAQVRPEPLRICAAGCVHTCTLSSGQSAAMGSVTCFRARCRS